MLPLVLSSLALLIAIIALVSSLFNRSDHEALTSIVSTQLGNLQDAADKLQGQLRRDRDEFAARVDAHLAMVNWPKFLKAALEPALAVEPAKKAEG